LIGRVLERVKKKFYIEFIKHQKWIQKAIENIEHANALWKDRRQQVKE